MSSTGAAPARRNSASPRRAARPVTVEVSSAPKAAPEVLAAAPADTFQEAVARLAHSYWEARGFVGGSPEEDWLRAEQELLASYSAK